MEHQQIDKELRAVLLDRDSPPVDYLRKMMLQRGTNVSAEAIVQWFRSQLSSPVTKPLPGQFERKAGHTTILAESKPKLESSSNTNYWILPAGDRPNINAMETLHAMLGKDMWGMHRSTAGRKHLKEGDQIAFYASKAGVVAAAEMAGPADQLIPAHDLPKGLDDSQPIYKVPLRNVRWLKNPLPIDESLRQQLDAYEGRPTNGVWLWFV